LKNNHEIHPSRARLSPKTLIFEKVKGKNKTYGRNRVLTPAWKKAMVTLKLGDSITLYEGA
jgi:ribosomal protein L23